MTDLDVKLKHAAYHEAAHAVVAYIVGICLERVFLDPKEGGFAVPSDPNWATADPSIMPYPCDRLKFPLAGIAMAEGAGTMKRLTHWAQRLLERSRSWQNGSIRLSRKIVQDRSGRFL